MIAEGGAEFLNGIRLRAYAKINWSLFITGKRQDGYHTLDTLFQSVSLYDGIEIIRTPSGLELEQKGGFAGKYTETEDTVRIRFLDGGSVCVFRKTENGLRFDSAVSSPIIYYRQESGDKPLTLEDGALFVYE